MRKKTFCMLLFFIISFMGLSANLSKDRMVINLNDNTWISKQIAEKIKNVGSYMYNTEIKDINSHSNLSEGYDVVLNIYTNSKENVTTAFGYFHGGTFSYSDKNLETADWVEKFSVKALEIVSMQRFLYSDNWDFLQLTFWKGVDEYPVFQNNKLYFISDRYIGNREVYIFNFETGTEEKISLEYSAEYFPDISPNENFLVFQTSMFGKWDIVLYNLKTKEISRVNPPGKNAYSPYFYDNTLILFTMEEDTNQHTEIWIYDLFYNKLEKLSDSKDILKFRPVKWDSNKISFYGVDLNNADMNLYYLDDNNEIFPLIKTSKNQTDNWSNGSNLLVFSEFDGRYFNIYEYNNEEKRNLTKSMTNDCFYPSYSPDKKYIFFTNYYLESDIFVANRRVVFGENE
ncbi:hypothetical protein [Petrotoga sp. 9PWA.NaAc.5.4]|uniref:TolB family protein n=1 Tax=Petrotoga sp. 9PWA.NaAc.5.4 TaxID=1434328 RepID=UPI000CC8B774|nr:hypothetical protein [Petrotoga sp. 9PWA.NaAc.5.4]PNR94855.1 hypothetical protein X924_05300 [Petrotoga sp. 9PWA.NaAc.5.4]